MAITIELVDIWLGCDDEAGRRLWRTDDRNGLFWEYVGKAMGKGWKYVNSGTITREELESHATYLIFETLLNGELKPPPDSGKTGKKPGAFPDLPRFHGFLNQFLRRIHDDIQSHMKSTGDISLSPLPEGERPEGKRTWEDLFASDVLTPEEQLALTQSPSILQLLQLMVSMVEQFRGTLTKKALPEHLDFLIEAHLEKHGEYGQDTTRYAFAHVFTHLERKVEERKSSGQKKRGDNDPEIRRYCVAKGESEYTYDQRSKRLRQEWRKFCDGPALQDKAEFNRLRQLISEEERG